MASSTIIINKKLEYEVPDSVMPDLMDLVSPYETEETKELRRARNIPDWPGKDTYHEELEQIFK